MTEPEPPTPKPKLRWYQYSLRTLLVFVTVCGILFGWIASVVKRIHDQRKVVSRIQNLGGFVGYDYQYCDGQFVRDASPRGPQLLRLVLGDDAFARVEQVSFIHDATLTPADFEAFNNLPQLRCLDLSGWKVDDEGLRRMSAIRNLRDLALSGDKISNDGLDGLRSLTTLRGLSLSDTRITMNGLAQLPFASQLQYLTLYGATVTDSTLENLDALTHLESLQLCRTQVTDAGLSPLANLGFLTALDLFDCRAVTDKGLAQLRGL